MYKIYCYLCSVICSRDADEDVVIFYVVKEQL